MKSHSLLSFITFLLLNIYLFAILNLIRSMFFLQSLKLHKIVNQIKSNRHVLLFFHSRLCSRVSMWNQLKYHDTVWSNKSQKPVRHNTTIEIFLLLPWYITSRVLQKFQTAWLHICPRLSTWLSPLVSSHKPWKLQLLNHSWRSTI